MNKSELVAAIAAKAGLTQKQAAAALDSFVGAVGDALSTGKRVQLIGFGSFEVKTRGARKGRNPRTGEPIDIAASKGVKFSPGKALVDKL